VQATEDYDTLGAGSAKVAKAAAAAEGRQGRSLIPGPAPLELIAGPTETFGGAAMGVKGRRRQRHPPLRFFRHLLGRCAFV
jgi:hypothetical protein